MFKNMRLINTIIYTLVFATGVTGLVYQVTWQKYLSRLLGSDTIATGIILAGFLGGLSLGYFLCGELSRKIKNFFLVYAILEGCIGLWCIFFPAIFRLTETLTADWSFSQPVMIFIQGLLCSAILIGIPTICMGGTIPILTRGLSINVREATSIHARVYAINTSGAFFGTLLAGFFLLPRYGLPVTMMSCGFINIIVGFSFYLYSKTPVHTKKSSDSTLPEASEPSAAGIRLRYSPTLLYFIAFLSGFYVLTLENVLIRLTNLSLGSSSYSFSIIVSVFILSIAVGSFVVGRLKSIPKFLILWNQLAIAFLLILVYYTLDSWPYFAHIIRISFQSNVPGFWFYYAAILLAMILLLILPVGCMGATIPIIFHELKRDLATVGKHSGNLLSFNTAGNLIGSLVGGIVLFYFFDIPTIFLIAILMASLSALVLTKNHGKVLFSATLSISILLIFTIFFTPFYEKDHFLLGSFRIRNITEASLSGPDKFFKKLLARFKKVFYEDGVTATVAVVETKSSDKDKPASLTIVVNGKSDSSTTGDTHTLKLSAHLPALFAENINQVLVIGLGTGVTAGELTLHDEIKVIDIAEISPGVIKALPYFTDSTYAVHRNPKLHIHTGDAFRILARSRKKWDIVISEPSNPWVTGVELLFTKEFYNLVRDHLTGSGVLLQWLQIYSADMKMVGMVLNTLTGVFPNVRVFISNSGDILILATKKPVGEEDIKRAEKRLMTNPRVRDSLRPLGVNTLDSILIREVWHSECLHNKFLDSGLQTMDDPKLHYIAGKNFFYARSINPNNLFENDSLSHLDNYLLVKKHPGWRNIRFTPEKILKFFGVEKFHSLPMNIPIIANSLKLKIHLSNPMAFPFSDVDREKFKSKLIDYISGQKNPRSLWPLTELSKASIRDRISYLINYSNRNRNWLVPYPIKGLIKLLSEGINIAESDHDRNWCSLTLATLLLNENGSSKLPEALSLLEHTVRDKTGDILLKPEDKHLLKNVEKLIARAGHPGIDVISTYQ